MRKIIIFGATGLVGAYSSVILKEHGYDIVAVGRRESDNGFYASKGIPYYSVDIKEKNAFNTLPQEDIDAVVHFAGIMPASMSGYHPHEYVLSVVNGTLNVLEYTRDCGAQKIIFAQSRADSNYLMGKTPIPSDIEKKFPPTGDHSIYSICKNAAVDMIDHFFYQYGIKRFELRFPTIYGYHPNPFFHVNGEKKMMAYRYIIEQAIKGEPIEVWGDPTRGKEIVYIKDTVQIIEACLVSQLDGGMYNVGRGIPVTLEEQILGIVDVFSSPNNRSKLIYRPDKPNAREYVNDISKTKRELGYIPQYDYIDLLLDFKKEMQNEPFAQLWGRKENYYN